MAKLTESNLLSIFGFASDDVFIGGAEGTILHFNGKGSGFTTTDT